MAEFLVETAQNFVNGNMGEKFAYYGPFVAALFASSLFSSLLSLVGMFPPTSDLSTTLAWAVMVFVLITYTKIRTGGVGGYLKGFTQAHLRAYAVQHFVRAGDAHFHGVPSFRQHRVRQRHHGAGVCGAGNGIPRTVCVGCRVRQASCWARSPSCRWACRRCSACISICSPALCRRSFSAC